MRGLAIVFAVTTACGRIAFDGLPCSGTACPPDAQGSGNPSADGSPFLDSDGDMLTDDVDNCIFVPNPQQHDEDVDGDGDVCDNCPGIPNADQANAGDTDAVGDACDPRPTQPGDSIRAFEPFASPLSADFSVISGTWSVGGDALAQTTLLSDQRIHDVAIAGPDYAIEALFTFTMLDAGNVNAGIVYRMTEPNGNGWLCGVFRDDSIAPVASLLMLWTMTGGAGNFERDRATIAEPMPGTSYRVIAAASGQTLRCAIDSLQSGATTTFTSNQNNDGVPGLRTNRVTGSYAYFLVYGLGGPL